MGVAIAAAKRNAVAVERRERRKRAVWVFIPRVSKLTAWVGGCCCGMG